MKKILLLIFILIIANIVKAEETELQIPKKPAYRLGLTYNIENEYKVTDITQTQKA